MGTAPTAMAAPIARPCAIVSAPATPQGGDVRPLAMSTPLPAGPSMLQPAAALPVEDIDAPEGPQSRLHPRVVQLWRIQRFLRLALVGLPMAGAAGVGLATITHAAVGGVVAGALLLTQVLLAVLWPPLEYEAFRYDLRKQDLLVQSGVLFRRWSAIPFHRIQHVDTRQGPLERMLGLSRLLVFTAAGVSADGSIPGLDADQAERLRDELSRRGGDDGV